MSRRPSNSHASGHSQDDEPGRADEHEKPAVEADRRVGRAEATWWHGWSQEHQRRLVWGGQRRPQVDQLAGRVLPERAAEGRHHGAYVYDLDTSLRKESTVRPRSRRQG